MSFLTSAPPNPQRVISSAVQDALNRLGTSFISNTTISGVQNVWTAASNVNGIVLRSGNMQLPPSLGQMGFYLDTTAPTGIADLSRRAFANNYNPASSGPFQWVLSNSVLIPAGLGAWIAASTTAGNYAFTWDIL